MHTHTGDNRMHDLRVKAADYNGMGWGISDPVCTLWYVCGALARGNAGWIV